MALNSAAESALDSALGFSPPKSAKQHKTLASALDEALDAPRLEPYRAPSMAETLGSAAGKLPKLVTEGIPAAARAFIANQQGPTLGGGVAQRWPWTNKYTPIPATMDLVERLLKLPGSVGAGAAELGPERAKPLTDQLTQGLINLSPLLRRSPAMQRGNVGELFEPGPKALGPSEMRPRPPGPPGRGFVWESAPPPAPELTRPGPPLRTALPEVAGQAGAASGPKTAMTWADLEKVAKGFSTPEAFKSYAMRTPAVRSQLRTGPITAEDFWKQSTAPPRAQGPTSRPPGPTTTDRAPAAPQTTEAATQVIEDAPPGPRIGARDVTPPKFSSTQVDLPQNLAVRFRQWTKKNIDPADFRSAEEGPELKPHVTVKYGLHTNDPGDVSAIIQAAGNVPIKLGKVSAFTDHPKYDVLKVDVESPELRRLNKQISDKLPHTDTHPDYQPHVTLAYLKKGTAAKYVDKEGFEGQTFTPSGVRFNPTKGEPTTLKITPSTRFEKTAAGDQGVMEGLGGRQMPRGATRASKPQADIQDTELFGQERAAREEAAQKAQQEITVPKPTPPDPAGRLRQIDFRLRQSDLDPELRKMLEAERATLTKGTKAAEAAEETLPIRNPSWLQKNLNTDTYVAAQKSLSEFKKFLNKNPEAKKQLDDMGLDPETVSAMMQPRAGQAAEAAAPTAPTQRGFRMSTTGFEGGSEIPTLSDPDDVYKIVQGAGRIKTTEDLTGELRDVSPFFKSRNGKSLDEIARGLEEEYPSLGERGEIREKLIDTLRRYTTLKVDKKLRPKTIDVPDPETGLRTELTSSTPPKDIQVSAEEWGPMSLTERRALMDFWRTLEEGETMKPPGGSISGGSYNGPTASQIMRDQSGRLDIQKMVKALKHFRRKFPMEEALRKARPNSPAISEVERWSVGLADGLDHIAQTPWWKAIRKMNPETMKDTEETMVRDWLSQLPTSIRDKMRDPKAVWTAAESAIQRQVRDQVLQTHADPELRAYIHHRDQALARENASRAYFGLEEIPEELGPYLPRKTMAESREAVSIGGGELGTGRALQSTVRGHGQGRIFETYRQGESGGGLEYEDPRNAVMLREWEGLKLRATHRLFRNMEQKGGLFRDEAGARRASMNQRPWAIENAPGGGTWYVPTEQEAQFLKQNLTESSRGGIGTLVSYANGLARNPNLVNPAPHVVKNMAFKELLAQGPVSMAGVARDAVEWARGSNPRLLAEFNEAMPFAQSGHTAPDILGRELRGKGVMDAVRTAMHKLGMVNRPSQKVIFEWADPAMRYSLFKHYRNKGMQPYEAGNNAWTDLIRYGTRSAATDFWKSVPGNFFVPWRFGTMVSLLKQIRNHPVRAALTIGAIDYLREARYRATGKWTHMPQDYSEKPIATLIQDGDFKKAAEILGTTALMGPGGDFSVKQIGDVMQALQGKGDQAELDRLKNAFWGISQIYNLPSEFAKGDYSGMLGTILLGEHNTLTYAPRRLMRDLPESLPFMRKSELVTTAEALQERRQQIIERAAERKKERPKSSIEDKLRAGGYLK